MDKIEIGEYVRTNTGDILKYSEEHEKAYIDNFLICPYIMPERIVKHSKNLIDLIEVGDILKIKEDGDIAYIGLEKDTTTLTYKEILEEITKGEE